MKFRNWKRLAAAVLAGTVLLACASCASRDEAQSSAPIDAVALADSLAGTVPFVDQMTPLELDAAVNVYGIDSAAVSAGKAYVSTGATAEEVAVFTAADAGQVETVRAALEKRVEDQKVAYTNYQPQEMTKLSDPVIETRGDTVILCVSDDNSAALSVIDEAAAG